LIVDVVDKHSNDPWNSKHEQKTNYLIVGYVLLVFTFHLLLMPVRSKAFHKSSPVRNLGLSEIGAENPKQKTDTI